MTEGTETGQTAGSEPISQVNAPSDAPERMGVSEAARMLASLRKPKQQESAAPAEAAAEPATGSEAQAEDAGPPETEPTGEHQTEQSAEPADELPPIEPPRSWKAEEKERFKSLPRETQAYLAERETERDRAIRQSQNEAAEKLKGLTAKEQAVEQARQQYEAALPQLLQTLQSQQAGEFSDVKTINDVERLAREDWPRYLQWDVAQKKIAAVQQEMLASQQRATQEKAQKFSEFAQRQDDLFKDRVPDMGDPAKAAKLQTAAMNVLKDLGFEEAELTGSWNGEKDLSLRDHRVQLLIRDATLWRDAQAKAVTAAKRPVPPVQRPGAATVRSSARESEIQNLSQQLDKSSGLNAMRAAAKLVAMRRASAR